MYQTNLLGRAVYVTCFVSQFVIGQSGCSVLPPSDAKEMLAIESSKSEHKNISTPYIFKSGLNHTKLMNCDNYVYVL